jgi:hypothetical protein
MLGLLFPKYKRADGFAAQMANDFYSGIPLDDFRKYLNSEKDKKSTKRIDTKLNDLAIRFRQFKVTEKLGVYGKARLHLAFINRLELLGYDQEAAKRLNEMILLKSG